MPTLGAVEMGVMVIARRLAGAITSYSIGISQSMGEVVFGQPVEGTIQADAIKIRQALVQLRMAEGPTSLEQCGEGSDPRSRLSAAGSGD